MDQLMARSATRAGAAGACVAMYISIGAYTIVGQKLIAPEERAGGGWSFAEWRVAQVD